MLKIADKIYYLKHLLGDIWTGVTIIMDESVLIVDTATDEAVDKTIHPALLKMEISQSNSPSWVVNTHCHCDHIGGNAKLKAIHEVKIAAHDDAVPFIEDHRLQYDVLFGAFHGFEGLEVDIEGFLALAGEDTQVDRPLKEGDRIDTGELEFTVLTTPGHSTGSISLYEPSLGLLITGDAVQGFGTMDTKVPLIVDISAYQSSLRRLLELDISILVADHPFTPHKSAIFRGQRAKTFVRESAAAADEYLERVAKRMREIPSPISLLDLGRRLACDEGLDRSSPYIMMLTAACLDELEKSGDVRRMFGEGWDPHSTFMTTG